MNLMKASLLASALALGLGTALSTAAADDSRKLGQVIDDATVTASVKTRLLDDERTQGFDINVTTKNGVVTLEGGADSLAAKAAAGEIAASAKGVVAVDNQLVVAPRGTEARQDANTATASGELREGMSDAGDAMDDGWITSKVKSKLLADDQVEGMAINVDTKGNVVILTGTAPSAEARARAINLARETKGVRGVIASDLLVEPR